MMETNIVDDINFDLIPHKSMFEVEWIRNYFIKKQNHKKSFIEMCILYFKHSSVIENEDMSLQCLDHEIL